MVLNYLEVRKRTQDRDKSLREKVMSLEEAAKFVSDGNHIALGGSTASRTSFALLWALIRAKKKDLTIEK